MPSLETSLQATASKIVLGDRGLVKKTDGIGAAFYLAANKINESIVRSSHNYQL